MVWVSDITYVRAGGKWCYICVIIDLFSRNLIAWRVSYNANADLLVKTLETAMKARSYPKNVIFHSDRGVQYTSQEFRNAADRFDIVQSFSAKGCPYDNAVAESFFKFLKLEEISRKSFVKLDDLKLALTAYALWYNNDRPHSANNGLSPIQRELSFCPLI